MGLNNIMRLASFRLFAIFAASIIAVNIAPTGSAQDAPAATPQQPTLIRNIQVQGNIDLSIKTLYATGLFADVAIEPREGGNILIRVIENPIINRVILEGCSAYHRALSSIRPLCRDCRA